MTPYHIDIYIVYVYAYVHTYITTQGCSAQRMCTLCVVIHHWPTSTQQCVLTHVQHNSIYSMHTVVIHCVCVCVCVRAPAFIYV